MSPIHPKELRSQIAFVKEERKAADRAEQDQETYAKQQRPEQNEKDEEVAQEKGHAKMVRVMEEMEREKEMEPAPRSPNRKERARAREAEKQAEREKTSAELDSAFGKFAVEEKKEEKK